MEPTSAPPPHFPSLRLHLAPNGASEWPVWTKRRCGQQNSLSAKSATHLASVVPRSIGWASCRPPPASKSRQVISHRDITEARAKPYRTCPHTEFQARPGLRSRARGRSGPVPPPRRCLAGCRPITCATSSLSTAFEVQALMWGGFAAAAGRHREATTGRRDRAQLASGRRRSDVRREGKGKRHLASLAFGFARGSTDTVKGLDERTAGEL